MNIEQLMRIELLQYLMIKWDTAYRHNNLNRAMVVKTQIKCIHCMGVQELAGYYTAFKQYHTPTQNQPTQLALC
jgi:hypothetical protein